MCCIASFLVFGWLVGIFCLFVCLFVCLHRGAGSYVVQLHSLFLVGWLVGKFVCLSVCLSAQRGGAIRCTASFLLFGCSSVCLSVCKSEWSA